MVDHDDARWEHGFHPLRVKAIVQETHDTRSFVLDVPPELHDLFRYRPGQFCTFRVHIDDDEQQRCYSMSSAPETDDDLTVTVKRVPGGLVSNWFHDHVSEGDTLEVTKPAGVFCLRDHDRPVVGFVGGSGVTPVMSHRQEPDGRDRSRPARLLYANTARPSVIFDEQLEALQTEPSRSPRGASPPRRRRWVPRGAGHRRVRVRPASTPTSTSAGRARSWTSSRRHCSTLGVEPDQILIERFVTADQPARARRRRPTRPHTGTGRRCPRRS